MGRGWGGSPELGGRASCLKDALDTWGARGVAGVGAACEPEPMVPGYAARAPEGLCSWEAARTSHTAVVPPLAQGVHPKPGQLHSFYFIF